MVTKGTRFFGFEKCDYRGATLSKYFATARFFSGLVLLRQGYMRKAGFERSQRSGTPNSVTKPEALGVFAAEEN